MKNEEISLNEIGGFVPFPTVFFDEQMPCLKDTEWRLLCVIVRQTLGWQSGKGRKKRDWMSQKQLMARTGRNSAALSASLDALVRKGIVQCHDSDGKPLTTKQQRRQHRGRIYFSLAPHVLDSPNRNEAKSRKHQKKNLAAISENRDALLPRIEFGWRRAGEVAKRHVYLPSLGEAKGVLD